MHSRKPPNKKSKPVAKELLDVSGRLMNESRERIFAAESALSREEDEPGKAAPALNKGKSTK